LFLFSKYKIKAQRKKISWWSSLLFHSWHSVDKKSDSILFDCVRSVSNCHECLRINIEKDKRARIMIHCKNIDFFIKDFRKTSADHSLEFSVGNFSRILSNDPCQANRFPNIKWFHRVRKGICIACKCKWSIELYGGRWKQRSNVGSFGVDSSR